MTSPIQRLGEILSLEYGKPLPEADRDSGGSVAVAGSNGIQGQHSQALVKGPGIVVGRKGSAGQVNWFDQDFWPIDTTYYVVPKKKLNLRWVYYLLCSSNLNELATATGVPGLNRNDVYEIPVNVPPVQEQARISALLDQAEVLRSIRGNADELTLNFAPALFQQMFGDPVSNSGGWPVSTVGAELAMLEYGPRFYNEAYTESGTRIVRITDLDVDGSLRFDDMPRIEVDAKILEARQLKPGDFIFARSGATVGKVALIPDGAPPCIAGAYFVRFRFSESVDPVFGFELLRSPAIQGIIVQQSKQAAQQNFSGPLIRALPLIMPARELQKAFAGHMRKMRPLLLAQNKSRSRLDNLFHSLLNNAFAGAL